MGRRKLSEGEKARKKAEKAKAEIRAKVQDRRTLIREFGDSLAAEFRDNKTNALYLCWVVEISRVQGALALRYVELPRFRLKQINAFIKLTAEAHEEGKLNQQDLETVLDYLYAELNKRLAKTEKKLDA